MPCGFRRKGGAETAGTPGSSKPPCLTGSANPLRGLLFVRQGAVTHTSAAIPLGLEESVGASLVIHIESPYIHRLNPVQLPLQGDPLHQIEAWLRGEPSIQELMSDPIIHLVMRRDGLTPEIVWAVIQAASVELQVKPKEVA